MPFFPFFAILAGVGVQGIYELITKKIGKIFHSEESLIKTPKPEGQDESAPDLSETNGSNPQTLKLLKVMMGLILIMSAAISSFYSTMKIHTISVITTFLSVEPKVHLDQGWKDNITIYFTSSLQIGLIRTFPRMQR